MFAASLKGGFYFAAGLGFLALAKLKYLIQGYTTPKPYALEEIDRCVDYDVHIADRFLAQLRKYSGADVAGKRVLELGPGSDMGVGLLLVAKGASHYTGFDRHDLASRVPASFYEHIGSRGDICPAVDVNALADGRVTYVARPDFDVVAAVEQPVDVIFSNAAFEHFDDVDATVDGLTHVAGEGATLVAEVDLQTHSRWIREVDPNNIYRYPAWLYRLFWFPGQPNRIRPSQYRRALERNGWTNIQWWPENTLDSALEGRRVHPQFEHQNTNWLSFVICATK